MLVARPPVGSGPEGTPKGVGFNQVDLVVVPERGGCSRDDVAPVSGLLCGDTPIVAHSPEGPSPEGVSPCVGLDEVDLVTVSERICISRDDVPPIRGLPDGVTPIVAHSPVGPSPEGIPPCVGLDEVDLVAVPERIGISHDDVAPILSLLDGVTQIVIRPPVGPLPPLLGVGVGGGEQGVNARSVKDEERETREHVSYHDDLLLSFRASSRGAGRSPALTAASI